MTTILVHPNIIVAISGTKFSERFTVFFACYFFHFWINKCGVYQKWINCGDGTCTLQMAITLFINSAGLTCFHVLAADRMISEHERT